MDNRSRRSGKSSKKSAMRSKKRKSIENGDFEAHGTYAENEDSQNLAEEDKVNETDRRKKNGELSLKKKKKKEKRREVAVNKDDRLEDKDAEKNKLSEAGGRKKKSKLSLKKKRKKEKGSEVPVNYGNWLDNESENGLNENNQCDAEEGKLSEVMHRKEKGELSSKKKTKKGKGKEFDADRLGQEDKSKKTGKSKKKNQLTSEKEWNQGEKNVEGEDDVCYISSGDEDCSKGMKKWITEYHQSRPGLKILQQRIDEYITGYEAQEEQASKKREALAAEGGWTVVTHHKGRKKTTESESGVTVGSISQAAVADKLAKKKNKVALDFYNFQRREAKRNEVVMLQSKFEQDKKRIQQMRAARKFRPY